MISKKTATNLTNTCAAFMIAAIACMAGSLWFRVNAKTPTALNDSPPATEWTAGEPGSTETAFYIPVWRFTCWGPWSPYRYSKSIEIDSDRSLILLLDSRDTRFTLAWNGHAIGPKSSEYFRRHRILIPSKYLNDGANTLELTEVGAIWSGPPILAELHLGSPDEIAAYELRLASNEILRVTSNLSLALAAMFAAIASTRRSPWRGNRVLVPYSGYCLTLFAWSAMNSQWVKAPLYRFQFEFALHAAEILSVLFYAYFAYRLLSETAWNHLKVLRAGLAGFLLLGTAAALIANHVPYTDRLWDYPALSAGLSMLQSAPKILWRIPLALCAVIALIAGRGSAALVILLEGLIYVRYVRNDIANTIDPGALSAIYLAIYLTIILLELRRPGRKSTGRKL